MSIENPTAEDYAAALADITAVSEARAREYDEAEAIRNNVFATPRGEWERGYNAAMRDAAELLSDLRQERHGR